MKRIFTALAVIFLITSPTFAADITECQIFTKAGTYVLQNDVTSNGTCFAIAANNVILDLNGYNATYDNATPISVANSGFESDLSEGWDATLATNATRAIGNTMGLTAYSGDYALRVATPCDNQTIITSQEYELQPNTRYSVSMMYYNMVQDGGSINATISFNDTAAAATWTGITWRGFQYVYAQYTTGSSVENRKIKIAITGAEVSSGELFFDDIKIQQSGHYGVNIGSSGGLSYYGIVVKNGGIKQGQARGDFSHAIYAWINPYTAAGAVFDDLDIYSWGVSSHGLFASYLSNSQVTNCNLDSGVETIASRDNAQGYVIKTGWDSWGGIISNNTITNSVQGGIVVGSSDSSDPMIISNNKIYLAAKYTNAFGIGGGGIIANNTIDSVSNGGSGRGIMATTSNGADIYGNTITVQHRASNQEYKGCPGEAYGFQTEKEAQNVKFHNNIVNVLADECGAVGYMFWGPEEETEMGNEIYDNVFNATVKAGSSQRASTLRLLQRYETAARSIRDNTLRSNGHFVWFWGTQTSTIHLDRDLLLDGNTFETIYPVASNYRALISSTNSEASSPRNVSIINNTYTDEYTRAALEDSPIYSLSALGKDSYAYNIVVSGDDPTPNATCDINNLNLCNESQCDALGKYWYDGACNANPKPVDPEEPTTTTSGPILRTGSSLLRVGDGVLRVQ